MGAYPRGTPINLVERVFIIDPLTEVSTPSNADAARFTIRRPDDTLVTYVFGVDANVLNPATGVYVCKLSASLLPTGVYRYDFVSTNPDAESTDTFEVLPDGVSAPAASPVPVPGPCTPWINGDDVAETCSAADVGSDTWKLEDAAVMASGLMFELSGRVFNGMCERTIRPCGDPCSCFAQSRAAGFTWNWTAGPLGGWWQNECGDSCGCGGASYVPLSGIPVREVLEVKIDGAVLTPTSYRLEEGQRLLRLSDPGPPVVAHSWPACQDLTLEDDQPGTFSIKYRWGIEPPLLGKMAAGQLACELYKAQTTGKCGLPSKVTKVVRQGVTMERIVPLASLLRQGTTGLSLVDAFIAGANPYGIVRRPAVWSPDVRGPGRRVA